MSEKKDSNELLNFLMIIIGLLFLIMAIMQFLVWADIYTPSWAVDAAVLSIFGARATISLLLGFWCLVSGIGMFKEEEYAMGMGLVVLSIMGASGIMTMIGWVGGSFDVAYWPNYIIIVATIVGVIGFFWLLFTYKRYD
ncbi:MAG: hypothetical protein HWN81_05300 [Candidatus Lokiarchaeota archaeon]|nr:hypothetical protein [Candidatus Lokiarchaeota archaeon]